MGKITNIKNKKIKVCVDFRKGLDVVRVKQFEAVDDAKK